MMLWFTQVQTPALHICNEIKLCVWLVSQKNSKYVNYFDYSLHHE